MGSSNSGRCYNSGFRIIIDLILCIARVVFKMELKQSKKLVFKVLDQIMGSGKSTALFQQLVKPAMEKDRGNVRFLYISPSLSEAGQAGKGENGKGKGYIESRADREIGERRFISASVRPDIGVKTKADDVVRCIESGYDCSTTHHTFRRLTHEHLQRIRASGFKYIIIIDETIDPFSECYYDKDLYEMSLDSGRLKEEEGGLLIWNNDNHPVDQLTNRVIRSFANKCMVFDVYQQNGEHFTSVYPTKVLECFEEIYLATYLFEGSPMHSWVLMNGGEVEYVTDQFTYRWTEEEAKPLIREKLVLWPYDIEKVRGAARERFHEIAKIKEKSERRGFMSDKEKEELYNLTNFAEEGTAFSVGWYRRQARSDNKSALLGAKKRGLNFLSAMVKNEIFGGCSSNRVLFTCKKEFFCDNKEANSVVPQKLAIFPPKKLKKGEEPKLAQWLYSDARAVNEYSDRDLGIFLINKFPRTHHEDLLRKAGFPISRDRYALCCLLQWVWRLKIRELGYTGLWVGSLRMREILEAYLNDAEVDPEFTDVSVLEEEVGIHWEDVEEE